MRPKHLGRAMTTAGATARRLDSFIAEFGLTQIDFVKLELDGYECDVLAAAAAFGSGQASVPDRIGALHARRSGPLVRAVPRVFFSNGYVCLMKKSVGCCQAALPN